MNRDFGEFALRLRACRHKFYRCGLVFTLNFLIGFRDPPFISRKIIKSCGKSPSVAMDDN